MHKIIRFFIISEERGKILNYMHLVANLFDLAQTKTHKISYMAKRLSL